MWNEVNHVAASVFTTQRSHVLLMLSNRLHSAAGFWQTSCMHAGDKDKSVSFLWGASSDGHTIPLFVSMPLFKLFKRAPTGVWNKSKQPFSPFCKKKRGAMFLFRRKENSMCYCKDRYYPLFKASVVRKTIGSDMHWGRRRFRWRQVMKLGACGSWLPPFSETKWTSPLQKHFCSGNFGDDGFSN